MRYDGEVFDSDQLGKGVTMVLDFLYFLCCDTRVIIFLGVVLVIAWLVKVHNEGDDNDF